MLVKVHVLQPHYSSTRLEKNLVTVFQRLPLTRVTNQSSLSDWLDESEYDPSKLRPPRVFFIVGAGAVDGVAITAELDDDATTAGLLSDFNLTKGFIFFGLLLVEGARMSVALRGKVFIIFLGRFASSSLDDPSLSASLLTMVPSSVFSPKTDLFFNERTTRMYQVDLYVSYKEMERLYLINCSSSFSCISTSV